MNRFCVVYRTAAVIFYGGGAVNFYRFVAVNYTYFPFRGSSLGSWSIAYYKGLKDAQDFSLG